MSPAELVFRGKLQGRAAALDRRRFDQPATAATISVTDCQLHMCAVRRGRPSETPHPCAWFPSAESHGCVAGSPQPDGEPSRSPPHFLHARRRSLNGGSESDFLGALRPVRSSSTCMLPGGMKKGRRGVDADSGTKCPVDFSRPDGSFPEVLVIVDNPHLAAG